MSSIVNVVIKITILGVSLIRNVIFVIELFETVKYAVKKVSVTSVTMDSIFLRASLSASMLTTLSSVRMKLLKIGLCSRTAIGAVVNVLKGTILILPQKSVKSVLSIMLSLVQLTRFLNVKKGLRLVLMNKLVLK